MATPQIPWARVLVEGVVIVASILLAFGIDAWWDGRGERVEEHEYLSALREELASVREDARAHAGRLSGQIEQMLNFSDEAAVKAASTDSIAEWMASLYDAPVFITAEVVMDELGSSGKIGALSDESIRRGLTRYSQIMERIRDHEALARDTQLNYLDPLLVEHGDLGRISQRWSITDAVPDQNWTPAALIEAPGLLNLINKKVNDLATIRTRLGELIEHLDILLEAMGTA